jgi:hypothetical protein
MIETEYKGKQAKNIAGTKFPYGLGWHKDDAAIIETLKLRGGDATILLPEWCEATGLDSNSNLVRKERFEGKKPWNQKDENRKIYTREIRLSV